MNIKSSFIKRDIKHKIFFVKRNIKYKSEDISFSKQTERYRGL